MESQRILSSQNNLRENKAGLNFLVSKLTEKLQEETKWSRQRQSEGQNRAREPRLTLTPQ